MARAAGNLELGGGFRLLGGLHDARFQNHGNRGQLVIIGGTNLPYARLQVSARLACLNKVVGQLVQLTRRQRDHALDVDQLLPLAILLQPLLGGTHVVAQRRQAFGEPVGSLLGHCQPRLQVVLDVRFTDGIGHLRGELRIVGPERDLRQLGVAYRRDLEPIAEVLDGRLPQHCLGQRFGGRQHPAAHEADDIAQQGGLLTRIQIGMIGQSELTYDPFSQLAGLQDLELGLVVLGIARVEAIDLLDRHDIGLL